MPHDHDLLAAEPWFSRTVMNLIDHSLHGRTSAAQESQRQLIASMTLYFLDKRREDFDRSTKDILSFFGFCERNLERSHSQILQDLWVLYMLAEKREGFFVEAGACDGLSLSNTLLLEKNYGWSGILAEPNQDWHAALENNRSARISHFCLAAESNKNVDFLATNDRPELSRIADIVPNDVHERNGNRANAKHYKVPTISLTDLLCQCEAPKYIDYLSLDTEGSEFEILRTFDFDEYKFGLITVEHAGEETKREAIRKVLVSKGYNHWLPVLTRWDDWYVGDILAASEP